MIASKKPSSRWSLQQWLAWQEHNHPTEIDLGLERVRLVAERLNVLSPSSRVITVAGTNGKGSCIAALEALLRASGKTFGAYTSPHFLYYNERIRINGETVSDAVLCDAFVRIYKAAEETSLTYFEYGTLAAMVILNDRPLDYWLLEVGLGGRLDAVNIVDPTIAVITSIALDHEAWLGHTREQIGREKAGICRPAIPLICADANPPASIHEIASQLSCQSRWLGQDFKIEQQGLVHSFTVGQGATLPVPDCHLPAPSIAAALEVMHCESLLNTIANVPSVIADIQLTGRMQRLPFGKHGELIVDVAHNPAAAELLAERLQRTQDVPVTAVVAAMADKDLTHLCSPLTGIVQQWFCSALPDNPRAASPQQLHTVLTGPLKVDKQQVTVVDSVFNTLKALSQQDESGVVLVFGSFFTVAEALSYHAQQTV